ncbi:polysaccharide deacetylase family protein [Devosia sp. FJ2-5-3]|jgi:peptidoglycan/xylan/chitin deacetylase (PgdA/CDA1 family)|uniref:polysaccharide deacetylase family protein n=1 Tax=Devosia sp. FJ2-5-3 TaxID=2976680 RepID=UPI0023D7E93A|nr:polysaccharide deacetylase family protein [Devosia sp. FJ2-5-3]WEJ58842.1 polysaccharide deacetylase family protein [Devosia sp. FJ2-5-3]
MHEFHARWNRRITARLPVKPKFNRHRAPMASISFDDFPRSAWIEGGPILRRHGVRATYYTVGGFADGTFEGVEQYRIEDLAEAADEGHEIASHSFEHNRVYDLSNPAIVAGEAENARFFSAHLPSMPITSFAYPYGEVSPRTKMLYGRLYPTARGIRRGVNGRWFDAAQLKAVSLEIKSWTSGAIEEIIGQTIAENAWLIFFTHDVTANPTPYGVRPDMLEHAITTLKAGGVEILPVAEAYARTQAG